ncbi:priming glycosyl transferase [Ligilactobacillus ceti DSM 22408]|uniref:Priming glycosyl transferase n=2 Tax=Ligilactobacillus TaxID=2767887 RepID=A0A0R2KGH7_9LACO|nr:priming glycosyl transferase [Ligilactobacillus ceti DSM 22408]
MRMCYVKQVMKRGADIVGSLFGMILFMITYILVYPIIKIQSPGPILFKQKRVGKNGKIFNLYKFRSMHVGSEQALEALKIKNQYNNEYMFKIQNDPRIYPFGRFMRKYSLDELPQFWNVLKGDMSLVGTRPPIVSEYEKYELQYFKRLTIKPGITGIWQVTGRNRFLDFEDVIKMDVSYINNMSFLLDVKILCKTIAVVIRKEGH